MLLLLEGEVPLGDLLQILAQGQIRAQTPTNPNQHAFSSSSPEPTLWALECAGETQGVQGRPPETTNREFLLESASSNEWHFLATPQSGEINPKRILTEINKDEDRRGREGTTTESDRPILPSHYGIGVLQRLDALDGFLPNLRPSNIPSWPSKPFIRWRFLLRLWRPITRERSSANPAGSLITYHISHTSMPPHPWLRFGTSILREGWCSIKQLSRDLRKWKARITWEPTSCDFLRE